MNDFHHLCELIAARAPEAEVAIDEPLSTAGAWFADVSRHGQHVVVEWRPGRGFGVSQGGGGYGEGPDAVVPTAGEALELVFKRIEVPVVTR